MERRFTATWPDGSTSRVAWFLWMAGGAWYSITALQLAFFLAVTFEFAGDLIPGESEFLYALQDVAGDALVAFFAAGLMLYTIRFASRRLLMPLETCVVLAAVPLVMTIGALFGSGPAIVPLYGICALLGIAAGWREQRGFKGEAPATGPSLQSDGSA